MERIEVRRARRDEWDGICDVIGTASGEWAGAERRADFAPMFDFDRVLVARVDGRPIGVAAAHSLTLTAPGGVETAVSGITAIGVLPTWRRRGVLRQLMTRQFQDAAERGEAVSALIPVQRGPYQHFGYGPATLAARHELAAGLRSHGALPAGTVRMLDRHQITPVVSELYHRIRRARVGELTRPDAYWGLVAKDPAWSRPGGAPTHCIAFEDATRHTTGVVTYRLLPGADGRSSLVVEIRDLVAVDGATEAALLAFLGGLDLVAAVHLPYRPPDDHIRWLLADPDRLRTTRVEDHLWLRLIDVATALRTRQYTEAGSVVLGVLERDQSSRSLLLDASPAGVTCHAVSREPEVVVEAGALAAAYLGGVRIAGLARANRAWGTPEAILRADRLMATDTTPWCSTRF